MILSIETATPTCAVALHKEGQLLAYIEQYLDKSHSEMLAPMIAEVLQEGQCEVNQLDAVAVSAGPGSYTGLRIGASTAKGICYGSELPLIAVNTLEALAAQVRALDIPDGVLLCPMLDARRMEVYCMLLSDKGQTIQDVAPLIVDDQSFVKELETHRILFFGSGAAKCKQTITHAHADFMDDIHPSARYMGALAWAKYQAQQFEDLAYFEPYYLKEFHTIAPKKNLGLNI